MDIAQLGFEIQTEPVAKATDELGKLTDASAKAETATDRLAKKIDKANESTRKSADSVSVSEGQLRKLGVTLDDTGGKAGQVGQKLAGASREATEFGRASAAAAGLVVAGIAAAGAAMVAIAGFAIKAAAEVHTLSQRIGISAEILSSLGAAARRNDSELDAVVSGLDAIGDAAVRAAAGTGNGAKQIVASFAAVGVSVEDANGHIKPNVQLMEEVARGLAELPAGALKAKLAQDLLGSSGKELQATMDELAHVGLQGVIDKATETGRVIDTNTAIAAKQFTDDVGKLKDQVGALALGVASDLLPTLLALSGMMTDAGDAAVDSATKHSDLRSGMENLGGAVIVTAETLRFLFTLIYAGIDTVGAVGDVVNGVGENLIHLSKSLAASAVGDTVTMKAEFDAAGKALGDGWEKGASRARAALEQLADVEEMAIKRKADYDARIAAGYSPFSNVEGGATTDAPVGGASAADAESEALARLREALAATRTARMGNSAAGREEQTVSAALRAEWARYAVVVKAAEAGEKKLATTAKALAAENEKLRDGLKGLSANQIEYNAAVASAVDSFAAVLELGPPTEDALASFNESLLQLDENLRLKDATDEMKENLAGVKDEVDGLSESVQSVGAGLQTAAGGAAQALRSMQSMAAEGSDAYRGMEVAIQALNVVQAIGAVLNQANGDPYTAFARMAAMAAAVAQLGVSINSFASGGFSDTAAERQASQGTGTVLGDSEAKSESIANAIEITADAATQLVGINRGMLTALQALQNALGAAGNQIARGAADIDFSGFDLAVENAVSGADSAAVGAWASFFGGESDITDQGIVIMGGALNDLLENIAIGAYQEVQSRSWAFGSRHTNEAIVDVSDQFGRQFQLVIGAIVDTVREGALALGLLPADIEAAIAAFQVEEIRISLKDLTAEEQQAELEAVFSAIFDGLAGAVVPFISQFQQVGEGLGETLIRIATEVQVAQLAFEQLGLAVDQSDPERFAQISDALIQAAGGLESFISGFQSFVDKFAPGSHQLEVQSAAIASAFEQVGLTVPATRDGMWALMQSLDATTAAGQEQIATLLRLADVADAYYDALEKLATAQVDYVALIADLGQQGQGISSVSPLAAARAEIRKWEQETILRANELARAAGLQGIAEQDLILIRQIAEARILEAIDAIIGSSQDLVSQIWGGANDTEDAAATASDAIGRFGSAMTDAAAAAVSAAQLLLGELSPLNDQQKLQYALDAYQRGVVDKEDVLEVGRRLYGTARQYTDLFNMLQGLRGGIPAGGIGGGDIGGNAAADAVDQTSPEEAERRRNAAAQQLAQNIASIAFLQPDRSYADIAAEIGGFGLAQLAEQLGLSQQGLTEYLDVLKAQESAVPDTIRDQTDRIVAALYDIAGRDVPGETFGDSVIAPRPGEEDPYGMIVPRPGDDRPPPRVLPPRGGAGGGGGVSLQPKDLGALEGKLDSVNTLLARILEAAQAGDGAVVAAVRDVAETLEQTATQARASQPRNGRKEIAR